MLEYPVSLDAVLHRDRPPAVTFPVAVPPSPAAAAAAAVRCLEAAIAAVASTSTLSRCSLAAAAAADHANRGLNAEGRITSPTTDVVVDRVHASVVCDELRRPSSRNERRRRLPRDDDDVTEVERGGDVGPASVVDGRCVSVHCEGDACCGAPVHNTSRDFAHFQAMEIIVRLTFLFFSV